MDAVTLQVVSGALRAICDEMGASLIQSAYSSNIKERHDCSTALFDHRGQMAMQAEHIPVHPGAMPASVAAVLHEHHEPGVSWILNDPFRGGTHLPDITVVTPVFSGSELIGFAASRAHHADVGGAVPGSMPANSRSIEEEGVVISPRRLDGAAIEELVVQMRQPDQRRADLRAQVGANALGARRMQQLATLHPIGAAIEAVIDYAERRTRACIAELKDGVYERRDVLEGVDGDLELQLQATVDGDRILLDFTGSAGPDPGNLNCPRAVTESACLFAVRVLTDPDVPASAGVMRAVEVITERGTLLDAVAPAAVAGGNVETSSRVADLVLGAFGHALGQGTMNNFTLGNDHFTYYETLGGGQGASDGADGPSAVHVAMSNTLNTPIEALELEFPMRVREYAVRRGSGGSGRWHGGDGVVRQIEALEPMDFSLIAERRRHAPAGAAGGGDARRGHDVVIRGDVTETLEPKSTGHLDIGDALRIETPGGGGFGP